MLSVATTRGRQNGSPIGFIEKHALHGAKIGKVRRKERWNLPPVALEIENPGLLPFGLTVEDLERGISKLRNRVIGRVFHALGLIEQWGSGVQRMIAACRESGLADSKFEEIATRFRVTIFTDQVNRPALDDTDQAIIATLSDGTGRLTSEIAAVIGLTPRAARNRLTRLVGSGLLREVGTGPQDPKRRYFIASLHH